MIGDDAKWCVDDGDEDDEMMIDEKMKIPTTSREV